MTDVASLRTKIFADGADLDGLLRLAAEPHISGFTTNPTLMHKAGISDYAAFAHEVLGHITDRPISFEVFTDDITEMRAQALEIASWGSNVYVKIPVTNTRGEWTDALVRELSQEGGDDCHCGQDRLQHHVDDLTAMPLHPATGRGAPRRQLGPA